MQLSATEQLCALALCAKIGSAEEDVVRAGRVAKQLKAAVASAAVMEYILCMWNSTRQQETTLHCRQIW
jgi:hypothetical protein